MIKKRILIVEDEPDMVYALTIYLESLQYKVLSAADGQSGLDLARKEKPDLIVLDLMLPKIDGYKVCRMLKFDEKYKHIPVIIVTAKSQDRDKVIGLEVGADEYITKPFDSNVLADRISALISKS